jgi:hypothetical protein
MNISFRTRITGQKQELVAMVPGNSHMKLSETSTGLKMTVKQLLS